MDGIRGDRTEQQALESTEASTAEHHEFGRVVLPFCFFDDALAGMANRGETIHVNRKTVLVLARYFRQFPIKDCFSVLL